MTLTLSLHADITPKQHTVLNSSSQFMVLEGPAGTGKTYLGLARALKKLRDGEVSQIVVIRSTVEIRPMGFLPGFMDEKLAPYADPYEHLVSQLSPKKNFKALVKAGSIVFAPTSFLRGVTFDDCYVIVDEYANCNAHELETIVTRVGEGTHLTLCGESAQSDLKYNEATEHHQVLRTLALMPEFEFHHFGIDDIVRSPFVRSYYEAKAAAQANTPPDRSSTRTP